MVNNLDKQSTFHGCSEDHVNELLSGKIDVNKGSGELGQGFYLGTALHVAKAWAKQKFDCESVLEIQILDKDFWAFDIQCFTREEAIEQRRLIRSIEKTTSFKFNKDVLWSPIIGGPVVYADQHKWESQKGELFLNSTNVLRTKR